MTRAIRDLRVSSSNEAEVTKRKAAFDKLVKEEIPQNREDIKIARAYGDLRENFEYKAAKEFQRVLLKRQDDWQNDLKIATPTDFSSSDTSAASIGTVVELKPVTLGTRLIRLTGAPSICLRVHLYIKKDVLKVRNTNVYICKTHSNI